jgi:hypothetical protein
LLLLGIIDASRYQTRQAMMGNTDSDVKLKYFIAGGQYIPSRKRRQLLDPVWYHYQHDQVVIDMIDSKMILYHESATDP